MRPGVNLAALDTMENHLHPLRLVNIRIATVIVEPQPENQKKANPQVEEKKNIYFQFNHTENNRNAARSP
jgi:hypothetical protein